MRQFSPPLPRFSGLSSRFFNPFLTIFRGPRTLRISVRTNNMHTSFNVGCPTLPVRDQNVETYFCVIRCEDG